MKRKSKNFLNVFIKYIYMVKVITISDEAYKKLLKMKRKLGGISFTKVILYLLSSSSKAEEAKSLVNLAGVLRRRDISRERLRRVIKW